MKNIIVVVIIGVSIILVVKRIVDILKGKKNCDCSSLDKKNECPMKEKCNKK